MRALAIAATGMSAQELNVDVIANNIANINTTGFKRARAEFTDLIYQTERLPGVSNRGQNTMIPEGAQVGLGVRTAAIRSMDLQGTLANTGNQLDLALSGNGWFQITGTNGDTLYTRDGAFNTNATGQLVTLDGYTVIPPIIGAEQCHRHHNQPVRHRVGNHSRPDDATAARPIDTCQFCQRSRAPTAGWQSLRSDGGIGCTYRRCAGRPWLCHDQPRLSRILERRFGERDHQPHLCAARLRDELEGHPGRG